MDHMQAFVRTGSLTPPGVIPSAADQMQLSSLVIRLLERFER